MARRRSTAQIAVSVIARTTAFKRGMASARRAVRRFRRSIVRTSKRIAGFGFALGTLATGGGIAILVKRSFELNDALGKSADKLGITTKALASLQLAGQLTGVQTNSLTIGLQRMTRRVSEAAQGTGEAKAAIRELGLDAKKLNALSLDKKFLKIADAFKKVSGQSNRVRLAFKLFDTEGVGLVNTMKLTADQFERIFKFAEESGIALSRFDVARIEKANDALTKLKAGFQGLGNIFTVEIAPVLERIADAVTRLIISIGKKNIASTIKDLLLRATTFFGFMIKSFTIVSNSFAQTIASVKSVFSAVGLSDEPAAKILGDLVQTRIQNKNLNDSVRKLMHDIFMDLNDRGRAGGDPRTQTGGLGGTSIGSIIGAQVRGVLARTLGVSPFGKQLAPALIGTSGRVQQQQLGALNKLVAGQKQLIKQGNNSGLGP